MARLRIRFSVAALKQKNSDGWHDYSPHENIVIVYLSWKGGSISMKLMVVGSGMSLTIACGSHDVHFLLKKKPWGMFWNGMQEWGQPFSANQVFFAIWTLHNRHMPETLTHLLGLSLLCCKLCTQFLCVHTVCAMESNFTLSCVSSGCLHFFFCTS